MHNKWMNEWKIFAPYGTVSYCTISQLSPELSCTTHNAEAEVWAYNTDNTSGWSSLVASTCEDSFQALFDHLQVSPSNCSIAVPPGLVHSSYSQYIQVAAIYALLLVATCKCWPVTRPVVDHAALLLVLLNCRTLYHRHFGMLHLHWPYSVAG